jgi:hypothetical protein
LTSLSRLWRLNFDDLANPTAAGTIELLLDGTEGQKMMDNLTVDQWGRVLIQEVNPTKIEAAYNRHHGAVDKLWISQHRTTDTRTLITVAQMLGHQPSSLAASSRAERRSRVLERGAAGGEFGHRPPVGRSWCGFSQPRPGPVPG